MDDHEEVSNRTGLIRLTESAKSMVREQAETQKSIEKLWDELRVARQDHAENERDIAVLKEKNAGHERRISWQETITWGAVVGLIAELLGLVYLLIKV